MNQQTETMTTVKPKENMPVKKRVSFEKTDTPQKGEWEKPCQFDIFNTHGSLCIALNMSCIGICCIKIQYLGMYNTSFKLIPCKMDRKLGLYFPSILIKGILKINE